MNSIGPLIEHKLAQASFTGPIVIIRPANLAQEHAVLPTFYSKHNGPLVSTHSPSETNILGSVLPDVTHYAVVCYRHCVNILGCAV